MNEQDDKYSGVPGLSLMNDIWEQWIINPSFSSIYSSPILIRSIQPSPCVYQETRRKVQHASIPLSPLLYRKPSINLIGIETKYINKNFEFKYG